MALIPRKALATLAIAAVLLIGLAGCSKKTTAPDGAPVPRTPKEVVEAVVQAWIDRDADAYTSLLTVGFSYSGLCVGDSGATSTPTYDHSAEVEVVARIFDLGFGLRPPVSAVDLTRVGPWFETILPGQSPYEKSLNTRVLGTIVSGTDTLRLSSMQYFDVIRADQVSPWGPRDSTRWLLQDWGEADFGGGDCDSVFTRFWGHVRTLYSP